MSPAPPNPAPDRLAAAAAAVRDTRRADEDVRTRAKGSGQALSRARGDLAAMVVSALLSGAAWSTLAEPLSALGIDVTLDGPAAADTLGRDVAAWLHANVPELATPST